MIESELNLVRYEDPGHSWLGVPAFYVSALGLENELQGAYFSERKQMFFLEEDCEMYLFLGKFKEFMPSTTVNIREKYFENDCPVRKLPTFRS